MGGFMGFFGGKSKKSDALKKWEDLVRQEEMEREANRRLAESVKREAVRKNQGELKRQLLSGLGPPSQQHLNQQFGPLGSFGAQYQGKPPLSPSMTQPLTQPLARQDDTQSVPHKGFGPPKPPRLVPSNPWKDAAAEDRFQMAEIGLSALQEIFLGSKKLVEVKTVAGQPWPENAALYKMYVDNGTQSLCLVFLHPHFPRVSFGSTIPRASCFFEDVEQD